MSVFSFIFFIFHSVYRFLLLFISFSVHVFIIINIFIFLFIFFSFSFFLEKEEGWKHARRIYPKSPCAVPLRKTHDGRTGGVSRRMVGVVTRSTRKSRTGRAERLAQGIPVGQQQQTTFSEWWLWAWSKVVWRDHGWTRRRMMRESPVKRYHAQQEGKQRNWRSLRSWKICSEQNWRWR